MVHFSEVVEMYSSESRGSIPFVISHQAISAACNPGFNVSSTMDPLQKSVRCDDKEGSQRNIMRFQCKYRDPRCALENRIHQKLSRSPRHNCDKNSPNCKQVCDIYHTALTDITNLEVKSYCRCSDSQTKLNLFSDKKNLEGGFLLPPLPRGSLTFQSAMRDLQSDNTSMRETRGPRDGISYKCPYATRGSLPKLAWYGPLVDYKGRQVYLSTRNYLNSIIRKCGDRKWCS